MFNERLRLARKQSNFTQAQVSAALMLHRSTYAYYETGRTAPDLSTLVKLSRLFRVSTDWLLGSDNLSFESEQAEYRSTAQETSSQKSNMSLINDDDSKAVILTSTEKTLICKLRLMNDEQYSDCCNYIDNITNKGD